MVQINFALKQVNAKVVYYGPGMSGKTTNLEVVHQRAPQENRGELTSISTDGDRTLFFDFMPLDLGTVAGMKTCFQIYTVPGQVYYNSTRKLVLQGVDGVIFIADSSASMVEENLESLRNLEANLLEYGRSLDDVPMVIQYNKRDLTDALPLESLEQQLNPRGLPSFEATAHTGQGVFPTLKALAASVLENIHRQQQSTGSGVPPRPVASEPAAPLAARPVAAQPVAEAAAPVAPLAAQPLAAQPVAEAAAPVAPLAAQPLAEAVAPVAPAASIPPPAVPPPPAAGASLSMAAPQLTRTSIRMSADTPTPGSLESGPQPVVAAAPVAPLALASTPPAAAAPPPAPLTVAPAPVAPATPSLDSPQAAPALAGSAPAVEAGSARPALEPEPDRAPPRRPAPVHHVFGADEMGQSRQAPRPTPVASRGHRSALVTGAIVIASVGLGAVLGSLALSFLQ